MTRAGRSSRATRFAALALGATLLIGTLGACSGDDDTASTTTYTIARAPADASAPSSTLPPTTTSTLPPRPRARTVGVSPSIAVFGDDDAALAATMDRISATGAGWVRIDVDWSVVQRDGPDVWDFTASDRVIEAAVERGIDVIGLLTYTPPWARPPGTPDKHPPLDPDDFARFAARAVARYRSLGVDTWEIWNEPNISSFWAPQPDPEAYAALLVRAAAAVRAAQPDATVIAGGLAPGFDLSTRATVSPVTFLRRVYAAGAGDAFDAVGLHPYSYPFDPTYPAEWNAFAVTPALHQVLVDHGHADRRIWGTEIGAPTAGGTNALTPDSQARLLADAYAQWFAWSFTGPLVWYAWRDLGDDPTDVEHHFGLVDARGTPKPALAAFEQVVAAETAAQDAARTDSGSGLEVDDRDAARVGRSGEHDLESGAAEG